MCLRDRLNILPSRLVMAALFCLPGFLMLGLGMDAIAQTLAEPSIQSSTKLAPAMATGITWSALTQEQKFSLGPLEKSWEGLSEGQKRKWIAIAKSYPHLGQPEQQKLHSRMVDWAALSPRDRELARLNFAQSKGIARSDRTANWEAYQALSPEERNKLAQGAKAKPVGAAVAVKPVAPDKLTVVPITRHTPEQERAIAELQRPINRKTLLPQLQASAPVAAPMATPFKP